MNHLTINLHRKYTGIERHQDKEYLVAPMVMLTEGVHNGSNGPLFYPAAELRRSAAAWNGKPIVLYHPTGPDGHAISANSPGVIGKQGVGTVKYAAWEMGKLRAEAWLDLERLTALAPELVDRLRDGDGVVEVSTGLYTDNEHAPGWYGGKNFEFVARNHRPDHLALLPTGVGACAVADGCGLLQVNERNEPNPEEATTMNYHLKGSPLFGYYDAPPVLNRGGGDRDDNLLPLPVMNFADPVGPRCGCGAAHRAEPLLNHGYDDDDNLLPLPVMNFGHEHPTYPVSNGHGGHPENTLPLPSTV